jgi:hypothetical protein
VWKYLLRFYKWEESAKDREETNMKKKYVSFFIHIALLISRLEYERLKDQWKSLSDLQIKNWKEYQIKLDQV